MKFILHEIGSSSESYIYKKKYREIIRYREMRYREIMT